MGKVKALVGGLGFGAIAMYFWDPVKGYGRRAELQDKVNSVLNAKRKAHEGMVKDAKNRLRGLSASAVSRFRKPSRSDEQLIARIRSEMGHVISHPKAIKVQACNGVVRLSGPLFASEVQPLIQETWKVPGVESIEHQFELHTPGDNLPELQGNYEAPDSRSDIFREQWKPATTLAVGVAGGMLALYGLTRSGVRGKAISAVGLGLLAKSLSDTESTHC